MEGKVAQVKWIDRGIEYSSSVWTCPSLNGGKVDEGVLLLSLRWWEV